MPVKSVDCRTGRKTHGMDGSQNREMNNYDLDKRNKYRKSPLCMPFEILWVTRFLLYEPVNFGRCSFLGFCTIWASIVLKLFLFPSCFHTVCKFVLILYNLDLLQFNEFYFWTLLFLHYLSHKARATQFWFSSLYTQWNATCNDVMCFQAGGRHTFSIFQKIKKSKCSCYFEMRAHYSSYSWTT